VHWRAGFLIRSGFESITTRFASDGPRNVWLDAIALRLETERGESILALGSNDTELRGSAIA
jgi:hypothetical protein